MGIKYMVYGIYITWYIYGIYITWYILWWDPSGAAFYHGMACGGPLAQADVTGEAATAGHSMVCARGRAWAGFGRRPEPARRRRATGLSRLPRDVTGGRSPPPSTNRWSATAGHGMVCARGARPKMSWQAGESNPCLRRQAPAC